MTEMDTIFYKTDGSAADGEAINTAGEIIRRGGLVAFPTETVYGLGASALSPEAAHKIYAAKGRPSDNPLIVHVAVPEEAETIAYTCEAYYKLAGRFMPGPLTVILPKKSIVPDAVTGGLGTVAVRCPVNETARRLIRAAGVPIAAPSANRSGCPSPTTAEHVRRDMDGRIEMIIDGGACEIGVESTVITLAGGGCTILRPGAVTAEMLREVMGEVNVDKAVTVPSAAGDHPESPGMKYKHYSPDAEVYLVDADDEDFVSYVNENAGKDGGVFASSDDAPKFTCTVLVSGDSAEEQNHTLYALLREADERKLKKVYVKKPPVSGKYLALYNRLIRASAGRVIELTRNNTEKE